MASRSEFLSSDGLEKIVVETEDDMVIVSRCLLQEMRTVKRFIVEESVAIPESLREKVATAMLKGGA